MKTILTTAALAVLLLTGLHGSTLAQTAEPEPASAVATDAQTLSRLATLESFELAREREAKATAAKREADDLTAQQSMASSTDQIAGLTLAQVIIGVFTAIGLAASIAFTWMSLEQTRKVINDNAHYSEIGLRAYIGGDGVDITDYAEGERPATVVKYKNFGSTPATNVRSWIECKELEGFPHSRKIDFPGQLDFIPLGDLAPGAQGTATFIANVPLTSERMAQHEARAASFGFTVILLYDDVFGKPHVYRGASTRSGKELALKRRNTSIDDETHRDIPDVDRPAPAK